MSDRAFVEKMAAERAKAVNSLLVVQDGDSHAHARIRGTIKGLDDAMNIFRAENKTDDKDEG